MNEIINILSAAFPFAVFVLVLMTRSRINSIERKIGDYYKFKDKVLYIENEIVNEPDRSPLLVRVAVNKDGSICEIDGADNKNFNGWKYSRWSPVEGGAYVGPIECTDMHIYKLLEIMLEGKNMKINRATSETLEIKK